MALGYPHSPYFAHVGAGLAALTGATGSRGRDAVTILVEAKDRRGAATAMVTCETKAEAFAAISRFSHAGLEIIRVANQIAVVEADAERAALPA
jgi:predicted NAD/FAD-binding protein